jgi:hypothetical protein
VFQDTKSTSSEEKCNVKKRKPYPCAHILSSSWSFMKEKGNFFKGHKFHSRDL